MRKYPGLSLILALVFGTFFAVEIQAGSEAINRWGFNAKLIGITYHPDGGENQERYPMGLDSRDFWVAQVGLEGDVDYYLHRYLLVRYSTSLYKDCALAWAGYQHLGFRINAPVHERLVLRVGIGPTWLWRQNWNFRVKGYRGDSFFGKPHERTLQSSFIWHGGNVEAELKAFRGISFVYSLIPGWPEVMTSSLGLRKSF